MRRLIFFFLFMHDFHLHVGWFDRGISHSLQGVTSFSSASTYFFPLYMEKAMHISYLSIIIKNFVFRVMHAWKDNPINEQSIWGLINVGLKGYYFIYLVHEQTPWASSRAQKGQLDPSIFYIVHSTWDD